MPNDIEKEQVTFQIVSLDGNIGSGKSTLLHHLKHEFRHRSNVVFLPEPVDEWNTICDADGTTILSKFYQDQDKYAFSFQMMAYISRLALMQKKMKEIEDNHHLTNEGTSQSCYYIFTERSLLTDREIFAKMLYDQKKIEDVNYQIYLKWFDHFAYLPDMYIYINTLAETCVKRVEKRAREGEAGISLEYLKQCHAYHEDMFTTIKSEKNEKKKTLVLDGNGNDNQAQLTTQIREFLEF
jgi:deoxycitidine kinase/deoxyguanosine kinase